jgi:DMATS type aromatic prenyltransferase
MTNSESNATLSDSIGLSENLDFDPSVLLSNQSLLAEPLRRGIEHRPQVGFDPEQLVPAQTYVECGVEKLTALAAAVGLSHKTAQITEIFRVLATSWGDRVVGGTSTWQSDVSDDHAPFEFSLALDPDQVELRVLVEAQGTDANLQSNWQAGLDLNQYLAANYHVSLDRFEQIADLYVPTNSAAKLSMWHAVCFYPDKEPAFKLYLNPQAQSKSRAAAIVEESLVRLGFARAWPTLSETAAQRGPDQDEFVYFSLDLANCSKARVKVYLRHHDATTAELELALSAACNYVPGDATEFCQALTQSQGPFTEKPIASCFSFIEGNGDQPSSGTLYVPIGHYTSSDQMVVDRLNQYLIRHNLSDRTYTNSLQSFAVRSLASGSGMQSHISLRREQQQCRVAVYLNPEVNTVCPIDLEIKQILATKPRLSIEEAALHYENNSIVDHPFLQRLKREPVNLNHLWLIFANGKEGIVTHFTRRLASVIGRIDDEQIRCILTKQLNEELGNGDVNRIHRKLFEQLMLTLEPYKPQSVTPQILAPGNELSQSLEALYSDPNPYIGVGAAIIMEICGKQIDQLMANEFAERTTVERSSLKWLHLHDELEIDHANEVLDLARLITNSDRGKEAAQKGLEVTGKAVWSFFNGMYRVCFI